MLRTENITAPACALQYSLLQCPCRAFWFAIVIHTAARRMAQRSRRSGRAAAGRMAQQSIDRNTQVNDTNQAWRLLQATLEARSRTDWPISPSYLKTFATPQRDRRGSRRLPHRSCEHRSSSVGRRTDKRNTDADNRPGCLGRYQCLRRLPTHRTGI
jgi:hypothetical protein